MKDYNKTTRYAFAGILIVSFVSAAYAKTTDPETLVKESAAKVKSIVKKLTPNLPEERANKIKEELKEEVNTFLDFDELADRALGIHKKDLTEENLVRFRALLRELIERAYTGRIKSSGDFEMQVIGKEIKENDAHIELLLKSGDKSAKTAYKLHIKNGKWIAYDLIIEEVSLVRQYRTQFNKIISDKGFEQLIDRMSKKLEELKLEESGEKADKEAPIKTGEASKAAVR